MIPASRAASITARPSRRLIRSNVRHDPSASRLTSMPLAPSRARRRVDGHVPQPTEPRFGAHYRPRVMSKGLEHELVPTAMVAGGNALARDPSGRVVFVAGALPGERVRVEVETEHRGYATARLLEVLEPSPDRVAPPCPELARGCGACQWQHVNVAGAAVAEARHRARRAPPYRRARRAGDRADGRVAAVVVSHHRARRRHRRTRRVSPRPFPRFGRGRRLPRRASAAVAVDHRSAVPGRERGAAALRQPNR